MHGHGPSGRDGRPPSGRRTGLHPTLRRLVSVAVLAAGLFAVVGAPRAAGTAESDALLERLRQGGLVVVFRDARADVGEDRPPLDFDACTRQRQLGERGREEALNIARGRQALGIPFARVVTSPYCRARHTAYLIFAADYTRHDQALADACGLAPPTDAGRLLRRLASDPPRTGTNTALVTHACNIVAAFGDSDLACARSPAAGDALVLAPQDDGTTRLVGCLAVGDWSRYANLPARPIRASLMPWQW